MSNTKRIRMCTASAGATDRCLFGGYQSLSFLVLSHSSTHSACRVD